MSAARGLVVGGMVALALGACRGRTTVEPPIVPLRNMFDQDRYDPQSESRFFADGRTMRVPVEGTVSREAILDTAVGQGRLADDSGYVLEIPAGAVEQHGSMAALVERGRDRFNIYCRPCHDGTGAGKGRAVARGLQPEPPTFHQERIRQMPDGQLFATVSRGVRNMPAYGAQIPVRDRWAIVGYVRALQLAEAGE
jgi:mono/diheme cytochrome c family protein